MRRTGIRKNLRHGQSFPIFRQQAGTHNPAVQFDVFRHVRIPRLNQFLRNSTDAPLIPGLSQVSRGITLSDIGIDTADKIYILFHTRNVFIFYISYK